MAKVLLVDDQPKDHIVLGMSLPSSFQLLSCYSGREVGGCVARERPDVILLDINLPDGDGLDLLRTITQGDKELPVVMLTCEHDPRIMKAALQAGAWEYITKPYHPDDVVQALRRILVEGPRTQRENDPDDDPACAAIVGQTPGIREVKRLILAYAGAETAVLILGESGTGKELVARALHAASPRRERSFVARNCGAVPDTLFESEFFGTERGAYTGAAPRPGSFELADRGILFLDEVAELSLAGQVKLLRALEDGSITRLGSTAARTVDVRILTATNRDLRTLVDQGSFREDLYYRLNVLSLRIPPLRERKADIPVLVTSFLEARRNPEEARRLSQEALNRLLAHDWPGNVRELRNVVERAARLAPHEWIGPEAISFR